MIFYLLAKSIELDARIPFISGLRKHSFDYKSEEIKKTEEIMLEILDWNTQFCTLIDIVEYYLSQGIVFSNDEIFENEEFCSEFEEILKITNGNDSNETEILENRFEKSKSVMIETQYKERKINKRIKDLSDIEKRNLVGKIEKDAQKITNLIVKGF